MKFSGCLLTHWHTDGKYPDQDCEKLQLPIQIQLSEKRKRFSNFLLHFWILHKILNILKQRMIVIAIVFRKLQTVTNFVRTLSKKCPFRRSFDSNHVKESEILPKSPWECFYHVFSSFPLKLILKMSPLLLGEILSVSVNKLTADAKYIPFKIVRICYSQFKYNYLKNQKLFLNFLFHFWNLHQTLNILEKRMIVKANVFP